jgi:alpha-glucosidase
VCPGYSASNVQKTAHVLTADLTLTGPACNVYGNDILDLSLSVQYQAPERLNVQIVPRYLVPSNQSQYILPAFLSGYPSADGTTTAESSNLNFTYTNEPSFQFQISRVDSGEVIFSTYGKKIVFEDQFLELATSMPTDYNVYGLAENIHQFRLGNNYTQTFYAVDAGNTFDAPVYGTHPMYLETRYANGSASSSHGVYARNAHAQEWLLRADNITYRTIGGSFNSTS